MNPEYYAICEVETYEAEEHLVSAFVVTGVESFESVMKEIEEELGEILLSVKISLYEGDCYYLTKEAVREMLEDRVEDYYSLEEK